MRAQSLDALRGFAIIMMVLSGSIISWILPAWMSHAQVPPGLGFDPSIPGITWVDLVFPFFLFSMGAAFPFSVGSKIDKGVSKLKLSATAFWRGVRLVYFAIYLQHLGPWGISPTPDTFAWSLSLCGYLLLFPMFLRIPYDIPQWVRKAIEWGAYAIGLAIMVWLDSRDTQGLTLNLYKSNIIILLLGDMAFFATVIYIITYRSILGRLAVLPFIMAILLSKDLDGTWQQWLYNFTPAGWVFEFRYLKYLFIVLPGTIAGTYLKQWIVSCNSGNDCTAVSGKDKICTYLLPVTTSALLVVNLWGLFARHLEANLFISIALMIATWYLARNTKGDNATLFRNLASWGAYLLLLGLFFEAFEGGIKKDHSTFSYYFTTAGLAFYVLTGLVVICDILRWRKLMAPLTMAGQNPMIAYVATSMLLIPFFKLTGISALFDMMQSNPVLGFLHGVILTSLACMSAMFFTRIKWFWRT